MPTRRVADPVHQRAACEVAATGLRPLDVHSTLTDDEWRATLAAVEADRLLGLLDAAIGAGAFPASDAQASQAAELHRRSLRWCLELERHLLATVDLLDTVGIDVRVLKGPALAHLDYADPSQRVFRDLDLLVRGEQLDEVAMALSDRGFWSGQWEPRPGFQARFGKGVSLARADGTEIDLHRTLALGPFGLVLDLDDLWSAAEPFELGGTRMLALDETGRFLHACLHAVTTRGMRLWTLRDVAQLHASPSFDPDAVLRRARSWGSTVVVSSALRRSLDVLALEGPLTEWAVGYRPDRREVRRLAAYGPGRGEASRAWASLGAIRGGRSKLAYLRTMLLPDQVFMASHRTSRVTRLRRATREILGARRG